MKHESLLQRSEHITGIQREIVQLLRLSVMRLRTGIPKAFPSLRLRIVSNVAECYAAKRT